MIQQAYIQGVSTRSVDDLIKALGMSGNSKSQVSRLRAEIDEGVTGDVCLAGLALGVAAVQSRGRAIRADVSTDKVHPASRRDQRPAGAFLQRRAPR